MKSAWVCERYYSLLYYYSGVEWHVYREGKYQRSEKTKTGNLSKNMLFGMVR